MLRKIEAMYEVYGHGTGKCANCPHFKETFLDKAYFKCTVYGESHSEATDWRKKWEACGLIDQPFPFQDERIVKLREGKPKYDEPLEGQISIFD